MCVLISMGASDFMDIDQPEMGRVRCPKCGARKIHINAASRNLLADPDIYITCDNCNYQGSIAKTLRDALANWMKPIDLFIARVEQLTKKWGGRSECRFA
ncbi:MAG: hypothetical protein WCD70_14515 [Alphaproteobacteria bacterium]